MTQKKQLRGTGIAMVTPFEKNGTVDFVALKKIIEHLLDGGVDYLVVLGTTAETATMSQEEQDAVANFVYEEVAGRVPLVIGAGGNDTATVVRRITQSEIVAKYDALLIATPYYNKPNQEGLFQHYSAIAERTTQSIILYNVPGRTGVNMTAATTLRLAEKYKHIVAVKEASGNVLQANEIWNKKPSHFELISGDDALTLPLMSIGAVGVISVLGNALPKEMSCLVNAVLDGDYEKARSFQKVLFEIMYLIFEEGNPVGIKALMAQKGLLYNALRLPLIKASAQLEEKIKSVS